jgi:uncharacterized iron-regulated membrane protein
MLVGALVLVIVALFVFGSGKLFERQVKVVAYFDESLIAATKEELDGKVEDFIAAVSSTSPEQIAALQEATQSQSQSPTWYLQRTGRITASTAHAVLHTSQSSPAASVIKKICMPPAIVDALRCRQVNDWMRQPWLSVRVVPLAVP